MKFSEVIAELEKGSKDTFTATTSSGFVMEIWVSCNGYYRFAKYNPDGGLVNKTTSAGGFDGNVPYDLDWKKKATRKEITAAEAVQAILDGKTVFTTHPLFHDAEVNKDNLESINWTERLFYKGKWFIED